MCARWTTLRCTVAGGGRVRSDAFLTRWLGPQMALLCQTGEVGGWYFRRAERGALDICALIAEPPLWKARLTGLALAAGHADPDIARRPTTVAYAPAPAGVSDHELYSQVAPIALAMVVRAGHRSARLRAAAEVRSWASGATAPAGPLAALPAPRRRVAAAYLYDQLDLTAREHGMVCAAGLPGSRRHGVPHPPTLVCPRPPRLEMGRE